MTSGLSQIPENSAMKLMSMLTGSQSVVPMSDAMNEQVKNKEFACTWRNSRQDKDRHAAPLDSWILADGSYRLQRSQLRCINSMW